MIAICAGCCASSPANDLQDLLEYLQDLRYTDIQSSLLVYLLPFCLELWCGDLRSTSDKCGGFVEHLYPVLADRAIFDKHLTSKQSAAVSEFMRQTILEELDDQLGRAYQGFGISTVAADVCSGFRQSHSDSGSQTTMGSGH